MGFQRGTQPAALDRGAVTAVVTRFLAQEIAFEQRSADPFGVAHDCRNPAGHTFIGSCGDVVCVHCSKVVWS